jgi:hypothetical protein
MNLFAEFEDSIERGFRRWTERLFGHAEPGDLLLLHHAVLEAIESQVQVTARGQRRFPWPQVTVTFAAPDQARRDFLTAAFSTGRRLESDIRQALESVECEVPDSFTVTVETSDSASEPFAVTYSPEPAPQVEVEVAPARLTVLKGSSATPEYLVTSPRTNLGRLEEVSDAGNRIVRRNDIVFLETGDPVNQSVSRRHAHILRTASTYRLIDDGSQFGTRIFREGRSLEVAPANRQGTLLQDADEIYLGRACLRFERQA